MSTSDDKPDALTYAIHIARRDAVQRIAKNLRRQADELTHIAPAESMLMHSIARRLELKLSKM